MGRCGPGKRQDTCSVASGDDDLRRSTSTLTLLAVLFGVCLALAPPAFAADGQDGAAWRTLDSLRQALTAAGPTRTDFTQTYVPAGFSSGETERGAMSLSLPECLRWDYTEPYSKTFLLCGDQAHYWNAEDESGRRYTVDREAEPGLDLLMLSVDTLRRRYRASQEAVGDGSVRVTLEPVDDAGTLAEASLLVSTDEQRLSGVTYRDREGNLTRFALSAPRPLDADGVFEPPAGVRWSEPRTP